MVRSCDGEEEVIIWHQDDTKIGQYIKKGFGNDILPYIIDRWRELRN
jgi:hypothetical protein